MFFVRKKSTQTARKRGKGSLNVRRLNHGFKRYNEERKKQKDIAGLLTDVVNLISIQQTPIAKIYSDSYTFPFAKSTVKTPNNCSSLPTVSNIVCGSSTSLINSEDHRTILPRQKDVAGLLSDIVNLISIQQTPIAKIYSDSYTFPFAKSTVKTPNNCSSLPTVSNTVCTSCSSLINSVDHRTIFPIVSYSAKSIFSKPKVLQTRSIATQTNFEEDEAARLKPREAIINGRRIIDFQYFFEQLRDVSNHSKALCNLNDIIITNEKKSGLCTSYNLKCVVCNFEKEIYSENPYSNSNLNTDFVSGILSIECNFSDSYVLLAQMHLPLLNNDEFVKESKNAHFPRDTIIRRMLLKSGHTFSNFRKNVKLIELAAMTELAVTQSLYAHENIQREHPLIITQKCSSTSDNNLFEQIYLGNIQREHQLTTTQHCSSVSDNSNIQRESQLIAMKQSSYAHKNIQRKHQLVTTNQCSSMSDNNNFSEQMHLGGLLVEDEFEIKQENVTEDENEFETIVPDQTTKTSDDKLIAGQEQAILNMITIKQEINSDDKSNKSITKETTNKKSVMVFVNAEEIGEMLTQANEGRACENTMVVNEKKIHLQKNASNSELIAGREQVMLNTITVTKQEIDSDDENFNKSITKETTKEKSVFVFVNAEQIGAMLTQANEGRACENTMVVNEEQVQVQKKVVVENNKDNNMLIKSEFYDMEIADEESVTNLYNKLKSKSPLKKVTYKEFNNSRDTQGILKTAPSKKINVSQNRFESNRLVTATSATTNLRNGTTTSIITNVGKVPATSSTITNVVNATATTSDGGKVSVLMPLQDVKKFNENGALIIRQMPHDIKRGTYQGVRRTACMPGIASAMQQPASLSNIIPKASGAMYVPSKSTVVPQPTNSSNIIPNASGTMYVPSKSNVVPQPTNSSNIIPKASGVMYVPSKPTVVPQPTNSSNIIPNASGAMYVPSKSTVVPQPTNSSNIIPKASGAMYVPSKSTLVPQPTNSSNIIPNASGVMYVPSKSTVVQQPTNSSYSMPRALDGSRIHNALGISVRLLPLRVQKTEEKKKETRVVVGSCPSTRPATRPAWVFYRKPR